MRGGQARQPLGHQPLGLGRRARGARRAHRPRARRGRACIDEAGFGFMFAPAHHQATRFVVPVRHELAVRTIFNLLGPLTNPAGARRQLIGVSDARFLETMAGALAQLGVDRALRRRGRGRPRRGIRERAHPGDRGQRRGDPQLRARARAGGRLARARLGRRAGLERRHAASRTRRSRARSSRVAERVPHRASRSPSSTPAPRSTRPARLTRSRRASRPRAARSPTAARPPRSSATSRRAADTRPRRRSREHPLVERAGAHPR